MITDAILWVEQPGRLAQRVAGLTVLERQLHTAARAGLAKIWISCDPPPAQDKGRLPPGLEVSWKPLRETSARTTACRPPYLVLSGAHFIRPETLAHLARHEGSRPANFVDQRGASVVQVVSRADEPTPERNQALPEDSCMALAQPGRDGPMLDWLLAAGTKGQDGFMSRNFDRHISLAISRGLLDSAVTPNLMTAFSTMVGLAGSACFLRHGWSAHMTGAALIWLHSVLDGCDGELARIRFQESRLGAYLDFWGDNVVHVCLFGCMGLGFAAADDSVLPLLGAVTAGIGILGSAFLSYRQRLTAGKGCAAGEAGSSRTHAALKRLERLLEQRDFIYLLLFVAYFGWTYEFFWAGAVGSALFFALMLYLQGPAQTREVVPT